MCRGRGWKGGRGLFLLWKKVCKPNQRPAFSTGFTATLTWFFFSFVMGSLIRTTKQGINHPGGYIQCLRESVVTSHLSQIIRRKRRHDCRAWTCWLTARRQNHVFLNSRFPFPWAAECNLWGVLGRGGPWGSVRILWDGVWSPWHVLSLSTIPRISMFWSAMRSK